MVVEVPAVLELLVVVEPDVEETIAVVDGLVVVTAVDEVLPVPEEPLDVVELLVPEEPLVEEEPEVEVDDELADEDPDVTRVIPDRIEPRFIMVLPRKNVRTRCLQVRV